MIYINGNKSGTWIEKFFNYCDSFKSGLFHWFQAFILFLTTLYTRMRNILVQICPGFIVASILLPGRCQAHARWFIQDESGFAGYHYQLDALSVTLIFGALAYVLFSAVVEHSKVLRAPLSAAFRRPGKNYRSGDASPRGLAACNHALHCLLKAALAILFLGNLLQDNFIAPHFARSEPSILFAVLQGSLLVLLVVDGAWAGVMLVLIALSLPGFESFVSAIDYTPELFSLGFAVFCTSPGLANRVVNFGIGRFGFVVKSGPLGLAVLQLGLGSQFIILTLHDKLLNPALGLAFLNEYPSFNFIFSLGVHGMTNLHFVLSAGLAELCFGVCLLFNLAARLSLTLILFCFAASGVALGPQELIGHIPILASAIVLLIAPARKYFEFCMVPPLKVKPFLTLFRIYIS